MPGGVVGVERDEEMKGGGGRAGDGGWRVAGEHRAGGEAGVAAAGRGGREEGGVEAEVGEILGLYSYEGQVPVIAVYKGRVIGGELMPLDETMAVKVFPRDGLPWEEIAFPSTEQALKDYLRSVS